MELIHPMTVYKPGSFIHYIDNNGIKTPITPENMVSFLEQNKTLEVHSRITPSDGCISPMEIVSKACSVSDLNRIIVDTSQTALETSAIISDHSDNTEKSGDLWQIQRRKYSFLRQILNFLQYCMLQNQYRKLLCLWLTRNLLQ